MAVKTETDQNSIPERPKVQFLDQSKVEMEWNSRVATETIVFGDKLAERLHWKLGSRATFVFSGYSRPAGVAA